MADSVGMSFMMVSVIKNAILKSAYSMVGIVISQLLLARKLNTMLFICMTTMIKDFVFGI